MKSKAEAAVMTFAEWFKREYPLYDRQGEQRDTSFKAALRIAFETGARLAQRGKKSR